MNLVRLVFIARTTAVRCSHAHFKLKFQVGIKQAANTCCLYIATQRLNI